MGNNIKNKEKKAHGYVKRKLLHRNMSKHIHMSQYLTKDKVTTKRRKKSMPKYSSRNANKLYSFSNWSLFEELIITKILKADEVDKNNIMNPDESFFLLKNIAVNFTETLTKINYKNGFFTGKVLYSLLNNEHNYASYQESMPHLTEFLELCGFRHVMFNDFSGKTVIRIPAYNVNHIPLGFNIHSFEAGLISGFISSARHKLTSVDEIKCRNNNADFCEFECHDFSIQHDHINDISAAVDTFSKNFAETYSSPAKNIKEKNQVKIGIADKDYSMLYYYLSCHNIFFNSNFNSGMKKVLWYIASAIRYSLDMQQIQHATAAVKAPSTYVIKQAMKLLLVDMDVISEKPLHVKLKFNTFNSKTEFINLAVLFFNRLSLSGKNIKHTVVIKSKNGIYTADILQQISKNEIANKPHLKPNQ